MWQANNAKPFRIVDKTMHVDWLKEVILDAVFHAAGELPELVPDQQKRKQSLLALEFFCDAIDFEPEDFQ